MSTALILEGGGMRGVYTAGVLDVLLENNIHIPVTYGISAGACNALSYISGQRGRNRRSYIEFSGDKRYLSFGKLFSTGSIFGFDFIFGELAGSLLPFDYQIFFGSDMQLYAGCTDCDSGKTVWFGKEDMDERFIPVIASSSLPVVSNIVEFGGRRLLDGGVSTSIPVKKALEDGCDKLVIVLTREREYYKSGKPDFPPGILKRKYKHYPRLVEAVLSRGEEYNREKELCLDLEKQGRAFIIAPTRPVGVGRYSRKRSELEGGYVLGVRDARDREEELKEFLK